MEKQPLYETSKDLFCAKYKMATQFTHVLRL